MTELETWLVYGAGALIAAIVASYYVARFPSKDVWMSDYPLVALCMVGWPLIVVVGIVVSVVVGLTKLLVAIMHKLGVKPEGGEGRGCAARDPQRRRGI